LIFRQFGQAGAFKALETEAIELAAENSALEDVKHVLNDFLLVDGLEEGPTKGSEAGASTTLKESGFFRPDFLQFVPLSWVWNKVEALIVTVIDEVPEGEALHLKQLQFLHFDLVLTQSSHRQ
jgi:hypothetical protein